MENYESRIPLAKDKFAYIQIPNFRKDAERHVRRIKKLWSPPSYYFHYQPGGHVTALRLHLGSRYFGKIDLASFFQNVSKNRLIRTLIKIGYSFDEAREFAAASTVCFHLDNKRFALPYGFVQSPLLASVALHRSELGQCLDRLVKQGHRISVYVDDFVVSSVNDEDCVKDALEKIKAAATESRFPINREKSLGTDDPFIAFNILIDGDKMKIYPDRLESMSQKILMAGPGPVSAGVWAYVKSINSEQAKRLQNDFPAIIQAKS